MSTQAQTTDTTPQAPPAASPPSQRGISRSTLIEERRTGIERGQRKLAAELGFESVEDLRAAFTEQRRSKPSAPPSGGGLDAMDIEEIVKRAVAERLAPLEQETAAQRKAREAQQQAAERAAQEQKDAAAREQQKAAEAEAAQKQLDAELRFVRKVAKGVGAKLDKDSFAKLTKRVSVELNALDEDEFEEKFGEGVDEEDKVANLTALLTDIRKARPNLFEEEKKPAETAASGATGAAAAGTGGQAPAAAPVQPATTSRATAGTTTAAPTSPATPRQLDTRKLSPKQFDEYKRDPAAFRAKFQNGLIDYPTK